MTTHAPRKAVLVVHGEVDEADVAELNRWYEEEHRPAKLGLPGYASLRRFRAHDGAPHFLAIYELDSPEAAEVGNPENLIPGMDLCTAVQDKWWDWNPRIWVELPEPA